MSVREEGRERESEAALINSGAIVLCTKEPEPLRAVSGASISFLVTHPSELAGKHFCDHFPRHRDVYKPHGSLVVNHAARFFSFHFFRFMTGYFFKEHTLPFTT